ncbi:MAG: hypothetical protein M0Z53_09040 [Thermaerobacter sp.]|nr:hypothetical protein [Thermaerobacter sp.]
MELNIRKVGGIAGLVGLLFTILNNHLLAFPSAIQPASVIVQFFRAHAVELGWINLMRAVLIGLYAIFGASLVAAVQSPDPLEGRTWAYVSIIGVAGQVMIVAIRVGLASAAMHSAADGAPGAITAALYAAGFGDAIGDLELMFFAITIGSLTISGIRYQTLPNWLGWSGYVMSWLCVIGEVSLINANLAPVSTLARVVAMSWAGLAAGTMLVLRPPARAKGRMRVPRARTLL